MRISDWSSDVCSSDLRESSSAGTSIGRLRRASPSLPVPAASTFSTMSALLFDYTNDLIATLLGRHVDEHVGMILGDDAIHREGEWIGVRELIECRQHTVGKILVITHYARDRSHLRSEEHTSELQSLMRSSYAVFCLKKKRYKTSRTAK